MLICALNGVFIISMMVITIVNTFELDTLEGRTYIVTSKVSQKRLMREKSTAIMNMLAKATLKRQKGAAPSSRELVAIKKQIAEYKKIATEYRALKEPNYLDTISSEFEIVNNTQKEMLMYLGILAKLLVNRECEVIEEAMEKNDKNFLNCLLDLVDRPDIQKLMKQHENSINLKRVTEVLDIKGIKSLLSKSPLSPPLIQEEHSSRDEEHSKFSNQLSNDDAKEEQKLNLPVSKFELPPSKDGRDSSVSFKKSHIIKLPMNLHK